MISYSDKYLELLLRVRDREIARGASDLHALRRLLTFHELEQVASWETTCSGCRRLLDRLYEQEVDKADPV